jgi:hypothetical protein
METKQYSKERRNKYDNLDSETKEKVIALLKQGFMNIRENLKILSESDLNGAIVKLNDIRNKKIERKIKKLEGMCTKGSDYIESSSSDKERRKHDKLVKKEQRWKDKEFRKEKKDKRETVELNLLTEIKEGLKTMILDGNNMLFVDDAIRKLSLKGSKTEAEKRLVALALEHARVAKIEELTVIYDRTKLSYDWTSSDSSNVFVVEKIVNDANKHIKLRVLSASPNFTTSDDALVDMSSKFNKEDLAHKIIVTSDRELQNRLTEKGSLVMKSGTWFKQVRAKLGEAYEAVVSKQ